MIITSFQSKEAEQINNVIKRAWHATYINKKVGITKEDIVQMYLGSEERQIEVLRQCALHPKDNDISNFIYHACKWGNKLYPLINGLNYIKCVIISA